MPSQFFPSRFNSTFGNPIQNGMLDPMYGKQMPSSPVSNNYLNPRGLNTRSSLIQQIYGMSGKNPMNQMGVEQNNLSAQNPYFDQLQKIGPNITSDNSLPATGMEQRNQPINPIDIETKLKGLSIEPQINKFTSNPLLAQLGVRENKEDYDKWKNNLSENTDLYKNYQNEGLGRNTLGKIAAQDEPIFKQEPKPDMEELGRIEAENLARVEAEQKQLGVSKALDQIKLDKKESKGYRDHLRRFLAHLGQHSESGRGNTMAIDASKYWAQRLNQLKYQENYIRSGKTLEEARLSYPTKNLGTYYNTEPENLTHYRAHGDYNYPRTYGYDPNV